MPSVEFEDATQRPELLAQSASLTKYDRLGIHVRLIVRDVCARFGYPPRDDNAATRFVWFAAILRALAAWGHASRNPDNGWTLDEEAFRRHLGELETWYRTRYTGSARRWLEANRQDDLDQAPETFEPAYTEARLWCEVTDHDLDIRTMQAALLRNDREGIGQAHVTLKEMPGLVELLRYTRGGGCDGGRRLYGFEDGKIRLDVREAERGLAQVVQPMLPGSRAKKRRREVRVVGEVSVGVEDAGGARDMKAMLATLDAQVALAALRALRARSNPESARGLLLVVATFDELVEGKHGVFARVAARIGKDESTVRREWGLIVRELRRRLLG